MGEYIPPFVTCETCGGDGEVSNAPCPECFGQGSTPIRKDTTPMLLKRLADTQSYLETMRTDLEEGLTKIWNKVKDL